MEYRNNNEANVARFINDILNGHLQLDGLNTNPCVSYGVTLIEVLHMSVDIEDPKERQQMYLYSLDLLKYSVDSQEINDCILLVQSDVWSATRKICSKRIGAILQNLDMQVVDLVLNSLLTLCSLEHSNEVNNWYIKDGAFLLLSILIGLFKAVENTNSFTFGSSKMNYLPKCLLTKLKPVVYLAMKNEQLSVREHATSTLASYVELCNVSTKVATFQEVISKLNLHQEQVLPAVQAEGLLDICCKLASRVPISFLLKHWKIIFPTLERYVMHMACTVRQKACGVIESLANLTFLARSKNSSTKEIITSGTCAIDNSAANMQLLVKILVSLSHPCKEEENVNDRDFFWQRMEGRMLSIDILVSLFGKNLLLSMVSTRDVQKHNYKYDSKNVHECLTRPNPHKYWAHDIPQLSTWDIDTNEMQATGSAIISNVAILYHINCGMKQVLTAWIQQAYWCFLSPQYELQRITLQALPGLLRLCLWLDPGLILKWVENESNALSNGLMLFALYMLKFVMLHIRFLQEQNEFAVPVAKRVIDSSLDLIKALFEKYDYPSIIEQKKESKALFIEVQIMNYILLSNQQQILYNDLVVRTLYGNCSVHLEAVSSKIEISTANSQLDRMISGIVVRMLPHFVDSVSVPLEFLCVVLSWLKAEDKLRWILVNVQEARLLLLDTLCIALANKSGEQIPSDFICCGFNIVKAIALDPANGLPIFSKALNVLFALCDQCEDSSPATSILLFLFQLETQTEVKLVEKHGIGTSNNSKEWNDWDEDLAQIPSEPTLSPCLPKLDYLKKFLAQVLERRQLTASMVQISASVLSTPLS